MTNTNTPNITEKNTIIALILWFAFGWLGAHHIYLGKISKGICMLLLWLAGAMTLVFLVGFFFLFAWFVWWIVDGVKLISRLSQANSMN